MNTYSIVCGFKNCDKIWGWNRLENSWYPYADGRASQSYDRLIDARSDLVLAQKEMAECLSARVYIVENCKIECSR